MRKQSNGNLHSFVQEGCGTRNLNPIVFKQLCGQYDSLNGPYRCAHLPVFPVCAKHISVFELWCSQTLRMPCPLLHPSALPRMLFCTPESNLGPHQVILLQNQFTCSSFSVTQFPQLPVEGTLLYSLPHVSQTTCLAFERGLFLFLWPSLNHLFTPIGGSEAFKINKNYYVRWPGLLKPFPEN